MISHVSYINLHDIVRKPVSYRLEGVLRPVSFRPLMSEHISSTSDDRVSSIIST